MTACAPGVHRESQFSLEKKKKNKVKVLAAQSHPMLCDPMDCSQPGFSVHGILQTRILEWVAIPFSSGSSQPKDRTWVYCIAADSLLSEPPGKQSWGINSKPGDGKQVGLRAQMKSSRHS